MKRQNAGAKALIGGNDNTLTPGRLAILGRYHHCNDAIGAAGRNIGQLTAHLLGDPLANRITIRLGRHQ
jgi:hypothetical protein